MRIALLICGNISNVNGIKNTYDSLINKNNRLDSSSNNIDYDVFCFIKNQYNVDSFSDKIRKKVYVEDFSEFSNTKHERINKVRELFKSLDNEVLGKKSYYEHYKSFFLNNDNDTHIGTYIDEFIQYKICFDMMKQYSIDNKLKYDIVVLQTCPIDKNIINEKDNIYVSFLNNRMIKKSIFIGNMEVMERMCDLYLYAFTYINDYKNEDVDFYYYEYQIYRYLKELEEKKILNVVSLDKSKKLLSIIERNPVIHTPIILDHTSLICYMAQYLKPNYYVEYGVNDCLNIMSVAKYCEKVIGVDLKYHENIKKIPNITFYNMNTREFGKVLKNMNIVVELVFIDACHQSQVVLEDFDDIYPYVIRNGFIFLHDTFPTEVKFTSDEYCSDSWRVPQILKEKYKDEIEGITLPFSPGLSMIRKLI